MANVAIIIRTRNEARWINRCLKMVFSQTFRDFEVVVIDHQSTDHTVALAQRFPVRLLTIDEFRPGRAINIGIRATDSEHVVCLSAHCIPRDERWLEALVRNMTSPRVAGVYGRQLPFSYSSDLNKRDLLITFGLDHRLQTKDSFFHNANSLIRRAVWQQIPFDEEVSNIEDRAWGKAVVEAGYQIAYEPDAAVYHYHGIHQDQDQQRAHNIVRIMEALHGLDREPIPSGFGPDTMNVAAILPILGEPLTIDGHHLLERCLSQVRQARFLSRVIVIAEHEAAWAQARRFGADVVERPEHLAAPTATMEEVLQYALLQSEQRAEHVDAVVFVNYLYPFRPVDFFDELIVRFARSGVDTVVPSLKDYQACWMDNNGKLERVDSGLLPRQFRPPLYRGFIGLGCISSSEYIRQGRLLGESIDLIPFEDPLYSMKAGDAFGTAVIKLAFSQGTTLFSAPAPGLLARANLGE